MSTALVTAGFPRCLEIDSIPRDHVPSTLERDYDLFVGEDMEVILEIPNGKRVEVRDIVVLGSLIVHAKDLYGIKATLTARHVFFPGYVQLYTLTLEYVTLDISDPPDGIEIFKQALQEIIIDWNLFQRESAKKIGLRSILVQPIEVVLHSKREPSFDFLPDPDKKIPLWSLQRPVELIQS